MCLKDACTAGAKFSAVDGVNALVAMVVMVVLRTETFQRNGGYMRICGM